MYKDVRDLTNEQLEELKVNYYDRYLQEEEDRTISMGEMVEINNIVSDECIFDAYSGYGFTDDDFFCTAE